MTDKEDQQPLGTWLRDYGQEVCARRNQRMRIVALESEVVSLKAMIGALERRIITLEARQPVYVPVPPLRPQWVPPLVADPYPSAHRLALRSSTNEPHEDHQVVS